MKGTHSASRPSMPSAGCLSCVVRRPARLDPPHPPSTLPKLRRIVFSAAVLCCAAVPSRAQAPAADPGRVYALAEVVVPPRATNAPELVQALQSRYPREGAGRSAQVEVAVVIAPDGSVADVQVVRSTDAAFDAATVSAVRVLRFTPGTVDGRPVAVRVTLPIRWEPAPAAQPDAQGVYDGDEVDEPPAPLNAEAVGARMTELYPPELRAAGQGGDVVVRLLVDEAGTVQDARVESGSSSQALDSASLRVARELRFAPARTGGQAVRAWTRVPLQWQVETSLPLAALDAADAAEDTVHVFEMSEVSERPRPLNPHALARALERHYPTRLRDSGQEGTVQARMRVNPDGSVSHVRITRASHHAFAVPTVEVLRMLRFEPARLNGRPVAVWVELPIHWTVTGWMPGPNPVPRP